MLSRTTLLVLASSVLLTFASGCQQQSTDSASTKPAASASPVSTAANPEEGARSSATSEAASNQKSMRAYIDPTTGELREPTPAELAAEAAAAQASKKAAQATNSTSKATEIVHADGTIEVVLDPSKRHAVNACIQKDGEIKMDEECPSDSQSEAKGVTK